ncbi:MAG: transcription termination factor NusA [Dehalococcoidia bacterium]
MKSDFLIAITQLAAEKNLPREDVFAAVEAALASAYKKDNVPGATVSVKINQETGMMRVFSHRNIVEVVENPDEEILLKDARRNQPAAQLGETVATEIEIRTPGRILAQTAKQVVLQRLREAEREVVFNEYSGKEGDIISGVVQRMEGRNVILDLGKTEALLPASEQVRVEHYRAAQRLKVLLLRVEKAVKGPQVIVSRANRDLIRRLFELEVPEIHRGTVEIKSIAREPGFRSKVAVWSRQDGIDPVGACVGLRGIRIQNVVNELGGERIDVVQWDPDPNRFVAHALSPARVVSVETDEETNTATVVVPDQQLSLAIGKEGQNARLAAKLTGWRIDIKSESMAMQQEEGAPESLEAAAAATVFSTPLPTPEEIAAIRQAPAVEVEEEVEPLVAAEAVETEPVEALPEAVEVEAPIAEPEPEPVAAIAAATPGRSGIRFAEEVVPAARPAVAADSRGRRRPDGRRDDAEDEAAAAARRARSGGRRRRPAEEEEDDDDPYAEYAARFR